MLQKCRDYNNFNALMEILSGLQSSSCFRLKQTWAGLSNKETKLFEEMKDLMTRQGNFKELRKHIKTRSPPIIPYLGARTGSGATSREQSALMYMQGST